MAQGMNKLNEALVSLPEVRELLLSLDAGTSPIAVSGLSGVHRAQLTAAVRHKTQRPLLIVCADENEANRMAGDLHELLGEDVSLLFAREWQLRDRVFASHGWEQQRIGSLCSLAAGKAPILVATVDGLMQRTLPPDTLRGAVTDISLGDRFDLNALSKKLVESGYTRAETVEGVGQFALRGGILDVWSPLSAPVRVEFFDDEVDAMGEFDVTTQRRTQNVKSLTVLPAAEVLPALSDGGREKMLERLGRAAQKIAKKAEDSPIVQTLRSDIERLRNDLPLGGMDRYLAACYPDEVCALDYLSPDTLIAVSDGMRVLERSKNYHWELSEDVKPLIEEGVLCGEFAALALSQEALSHRMGAFPALLLDSLPTSRNLLPPRAILSMNARSLPSYGGSLETAAGDMERYLGAGGGVLVLCGNETRAKNFQRLLEERNIRAQLNLKNDRLPAPHETVIGLGALSAGSEYPQLKLVILTEGQLTAPLSGKRAKARPKKETSARAALRSYEDLSPGDLVVHVHHGIGRFAGIERMRVDGVDKDYIKICYAGNDSLYVPATQLDMVSKYIGGHGEDEDGQIRTKLSKLGGTDWSRAKTKARAAAKDLAKGLIALYAERQRRPGFAFSPDSPWQKEFEEAFDYEETDDQLRAIAEIKADMERSTPMDRLLCGDVGYGKTEVALRAVMKCVLDGKQAAILVPTTVLAQQHYATALNRFRSFPVRIEVLSRFKTSAQKKQILQDAAAGKIDDAVIIGRQFPEQAFLQPPRPEPLHGERQCVEQEVPAFSGEGGGAPALVDKMVITQGGVLGAVLHGDQLHGSLLHLGARAEDAPAARDAPLRLVNKHVRLFLPQQFQQVVPLSAAGKAGRKEGEGNGRKVRFPQPVFLTAEQQNPVSGVPQHFSQAMGGALHAALLAQRLVREIDDDVAHGCSCRHSIQRGITFSG